MRPESDEGEQTKQHWCGPKDCFVGPLALGFDAEMSLDFLEGDFELPKEVRCVFAYAILLAELGGKHADAKPLKGYGAAVVVEVVENFDGNTYRAVYTVQFEGVVYVLDAFQKKAKKGKATPKMDLDRTNERLKLARENYDKNYQARKADI